MADGKGIISSKYLKEIYRLQKDLTVKPVRYLTRKHIEPTSFEKMNVLSAIQIFSPAVTATIEFMKDNHTRFVTNLNFADATSTINFMKCMYKFFTVHDVSDKTQHLRQNNPDSMHFYAANEERLQWLKEDFCHYIEKIQIESKRASLQGLTKETAEALLFTANSTVQCVVHLLDNGFFYVLTRRFSSDPVEALFSAVRMGGGSNDMTDARTAAFAIKRIVKSGLMTPSKSANVANNIYDYCGTAINSEGNSSVNGDVNHCSDQVLPDHVLCILDKLRLPDCRIDINLQTVSQALVCGYLVRVIEERVNCDMCISNISMPKVSTPLMDIIRHQDRGGLKYPKPCFVGLIKHLQEFVEAAVPYCKKSSCLVQTISTYVTLPLTQCTLLMCGEQNHQQIISELLVLKFVRPLLTNIGNRRTQKVSRSVCHSKPSSRKILKL